ncbi:MAG: two-component regulator propeller domain-containing protein [Cytophagaceae bacterium]
MFGRFLIFFLLILCTYSFAQERGSGVGAWRYHFQNSSIETVTVSGDKIFAASPSSSYYLDADDHSINRFTKVEGLSGVSVSKVKFNSWDNSVLLTYDDGDIDIFKNNELVNISDVRRSSIIGSRKVNHIFFNKSTALLSADFGLVFLNLVREEVSETILNLTPDGSQNAVYSSVLNDARDSIFIATERGLMVARYRSNINLMDYGNWYTYGESENLPIEGVSSVVLFKGVLLASVNNDGIYQFKNGLWERTDILDPGLIVHSMQISAGNLLICAGRKVVQTADLSSYVFHEELVSEPREAVIDSNNALWIADKNRGLIRFYNNAYSLFNPNGPGSVYSFKLYSYNKSMLSLTGGYNISFENFYRASGYSSFTDNYWIDIHRYSMSGFPLAGDLVDAVFNPADNTLYLASYMSGLLSVRPDNTFFLERERFNKAFDTVIRISSVAIDKDGKVWVGNHSSPTGKPSLFSKDLSGNWNEYSFQEMRARFPVEIVVDDFDSKWIRCRNAGGLSGIVVFNEKENRTKVFASTANGLPNTTINCISKDLNGEIWVGTNEGVAVFQNPALVFSNQNFILPIFEGFPLLKEQSINAIAVDGANRKWVATGNGVWLLNASGTESILHFNEDNSPLVSNRVSSVSVQGSTGEVFFGTDKGIISYRGNASEGGKKHSDVKVFPNPVLHSFTGYVGITGLVNNASVKITDIHGALVFETQANGGMVSWNVRDYNGKRARAGIYLIFSSDSSGEETLVSKIAILD